jgi:hypothetical protein
LDQFLTDVFHNYIELHAHHRRLVDTLHEIQREEHPRIRSITAAVYDAVLNFRESYVEYLPNYPIAEYRIDEEVARNEAFKGFVEVGVHFLVSLCRLTLANRLLFITPTLIDLTSKIS